MVLPEIPKDIVKNLDNLFRQFIWKGGKSKIAYNILQNPKEEGGLNLVNLSKKDISLKATWPKILASEEDYAQVVFNQMRCGIIKEDIWRCNLLPQDVQLLKIKNSFWQDVLKSWNNFNCLSNFRVENQLIWYNSHIRIGGKPIYWKDAYQKGLRYVYQLFHNGQFKLAETVKAEFGISKMRFNSIKASIPVEWKKFFMNMEVGQYMPIPPHNYDNCINNVMGNVSKKVYRHIQDDVLLVHNKYLKWIQDLGTNFCEGLCDYGKEHMIIYSVTNIPKYRSFQYRILQRGVVTRIHLYQWKIVSSPECTFCHNSPETLVHLFFECPFVQQIWRDMTSYIEERFGSEIRVDLNARNVILNRIVTKKYHVVNFICLITKYYIYSQKCLQKSISFQGVKSQIQHIENLEYYIAVKNSKVIRHNKKWGKPP